MPLLKRYFREEAQSPVIYEISAEFVQQIVESNYDRRLSEEEIERMHYHMLENSYCFDELILSLADEVIDNSRGQWDWLDRDVKSRKPLYKLGDYWIGEDIKNNK